MSLLHRDARSEALAQLSCFRGKFYSAWPPVRTRCSSWLMPFCAATGRCGRRPSLWWSSPGATMAATMDQSPGHSIASQVGLTRPP